MDPQTRLVLQTAIADLKGIESRLEAILPSVDGSVRQSLLEVHSRSQAAIRYYDFILSRPTRPRRTDELSQRVAQAAHGGDGVGLTVPQ